VSGSGARRYANDAERLAGRLHAELSFCNVTDMREKGLHEFLENIQVRCSKSAAPSPTGT
jgi:uncharacterized alpha-E superfamily protein